LRTTSTPASRAAYSITYWARQAFGSLSSLIVREGIPLAVAIWIPCPYSRKLTCFASCQETVVA
jgi:hypothetical protein